MSTPYNAVLTGTFTTPATLAPITLTLPSGASEIKLVNVSDFASAGANTNIIFAEGFSSLPAGSATVDYKTNGAATLNVTTAKTMLSTGGFTFISDSAGQNNGADVPITGINQINHPLALSGTTGAIGDVVRVYGTTGMLQIAGMDFTVTAVNAGVSQTLGYLDASGFVAPATAGFYRKLPFQGGASLTSPSIATSPRYYPRNRFITGITATNPAVVTMSVAHSFQIGEKVRLIVPAEFGMTQMNGLLATITDVAHSATVNSITLDIDASTFTAFAFPTSATAATGINFAQVVPVGEAATVPYANLLDDATRNASINGVIIDTGVLTASKTYQWIAKKGLTV
jgi:hypothetical protein